MRGKLKRFAEVEMMPNVVQEGKPIFTKIKGAWGVQFFTNPRPIVVELACGRGEYTIGLAKADDQRNYIGIDVKGDRIWRGAKTALEDDLHHVGFLRTDINAIDNFFLPGEVSEVWLTFPDPRPKDKDEKHRLSNGNYLNKYKSILQSGGWFKFKTDNTELFNYTLEVLQNRTDIEGLEFTHDLYDSSMNEEHHDIKTRYEEKFSALGEKIKFMKFKFG